MIYLVFGMTLLIAAAVILKIWPTAKSSNAITGIMVIATVSLFWFCYYQFQNDYSALFVEQVDDFERVESQEINENWFENTSDEDSTVDEIEVPQFIVTRDNFLYEIIKDYFQEGVISLIIILFAIILFNSSVLNKYCKKMNQSFFDINHRWLSDKALGEIMLSIEVNIGNQIEEWDICEYFKDKLIKNEVGTYFVLGNPGEGKTVALHKLGKMILDDYQDSKIRLGKIFVIIIEEIRRIATGKMREVKIGRIPILINFSEIKSLTDGQQFHAYIQKHIYKMAGVKGKFFSNEKIRPRMDKIIEKKLNQGKFVILLDGYDEIGEEKRYELANIIEEYAKINVKLFFVIASRTAVIQNEKYFFVPKERTLNLVPLSKEKILEFLSNWNFQKPKLYWELYEKILENHQLEKLAQNPLLLTLICYLFDISKLHMPENVTEFYKEGTKCLLENWENEKRIFKRLKIDFDVKSIYLEKIAFYLYCKKEDVFNKSDIFRETKDIVDYGTPQKNVFQEIYLYSGIVEQVNDEQYRFSHRSFYEFFLAKYIARNNEMVSNIVSEKEAYQIALFYYGLTDSQEQVEEYILSNFDNLYVIEEVIIECQVCNVDLVKKIVQAKLDKVSQYEDKLYYQRLGIIAGKYTDVQPMVVSFLKKKFERYIQEGKSDELIYIIMGFSYFESQEYITKLLINYMGEINLAKLAEDSNLRLEQCIIALFQNNITKEDKKQLLNGLGKSSKYGTIVNILRKVNSDDNINMIFYQFIHETKKEGFVQWFDRQNLKTLVDDSAYNCAKAWKKEYGWKWSNEADACMENRYILVYYFLQISDNEKWNYSLISNRLKFVASYIMSRDRNEPKAYFVDIPDCRIVSNVEFQFHWKKTKLWENILYNPILSRYIQWSLVIVVLFLVCLQIIYVNIEHRIQLQECYEAMKYYLVIQNKDAFRYYRYYLTNLKYNLEISRFFETNSIFLCMYICWAGIQMGIYKCYYEKPFNSMYNTLYIALMSGSLAVFYLMFQDNVFRTLAVLISVTIFMFELSQHKNNMPSFREPQFQQIKEYLDNDIL